MEPLLITKKTLKKILKRNYFENENTLVYNKSLSNIVDTLQINWLPVLIILIGIAILIHLYIENKNKKLAEKLENEKPVEEIEKKYKELFDKNKDNSDEDDYKPRSNYESEYYKMLPKIIGNPKIKEYMY